jgi:NSS family neurotransmitter:Na+ symporter
MAYGAYIPASVSLPRSALLIVLADTAVALLAGLIIFPFVFAYGMDPGEGPGLIYKTLPAVFVQMPGGRLFGTLFFLLLAFAAITTMIGTLVGVVAYAGERWSLGRWRATFLFGSIAWVIGMGTVLSFNILAGFHPLDAIPPLAGKTIFELIDYFVSNLLMPIGGVLIAVFVGWRMQRDAVRDELRIDNEVIFGTWRFLMRYVVPISIVVVLLKGLGVV